MARHHNAKSPHSQSHSNSQTNAASLTTSHENSSRPNANSTYSHSLARSQTNAASHHTPMGTNSKHDATPANSLAHSQTNGASSRTISAVNQELQELHIMLDSVLSHRQTSLLNLKTAKGRNYSALPQNSATDRAIIHHQSGSHFARDASGNQQDQNGGNIPAGKKEDAHVHACNTDAAHKDASSTSGNRNTPGSFSGPAGSFCRRKNGSEGQSCGSSPEKIERHGHSRSVSFDADVEISAERCVCMRVYACVCV
jgi:hypothetical protein